MTLPTKKGEEEGGSGNESSLQTEQFTIFLSWKLAATAAAAAVAVVAVAAMAMISTEKE